MCLDSEAFSTTRTEVNQLPQRAFVLRPLESHLPWFTCGCGAGLLNRNRNCRSATTSKQTGNKRKRQPEVMIAPFLPVFGVGVFGGVPGALDPPLPPSALEDVLGS